MANKGMKGLFAWCKKHTEGYRGVNVTNMSGSWKDGLAFCALLHRFRPDLIDFDSLSKENVFYNNQLAFEIAEKELGIAALLDAEDMANMRVPDKLSVMTYLSQYYSCFRHCNPEENAPQSVAVVNPASPAKVSSPPRRMTDESICCICGKRVHLVQRYFEEGKLYHRTCHRTRSLEKIRGKNYFVKQKQEVERVEDTEKNSDAKGMHRDAVDSRAKPETKVDNNTVENPQQTPEMNLPSLVESLGDSKVKTVDISESIPSPVIEEKKLPNISHQQASSFVSELPKTKATKTDDDKLVVPKPRTRTFRSSTEIDGRVSPVPVAPPRSKVKQQPAAEHMDEDKTDYDETMNPFGTDSGSDSDTTLSSTTTEDEDSSNPFENVTKKPVEPNRPPDVVVEQAKSLNDAEEEGGKEMQNEGNPFGEVEDEGNPFGNGEDEERSGGQKQTDEGNPFENDDAEERSDGHKQDSQEESGNPFGDYDDEKEEPAPPTKPQRPSDRFNPFSRDFKEDSEAAAEKKKKRPAPVPPKSAAPPRPVSPSVQKNKSPHKKAPAPPPPPAWKESASIKMLEMNKANQKDPRFTENKSPTPHRPPAPSKSPRKSPSHASNRERKPKSASSKTRAAPGYGYPLVKRKVEIKMSEEEITTELKFLDIELTDYETKGVKLEEMLRFAMDGDAEWTSEEDELLKEWFELVNKKNNLLRQETDLVFQMQQQRLEQEHADIEFQLRKLMNKPESAKTDQDKIEEEELLQKLVEVVESRDVIINSIEEERLKEVEEDTAYEQMKRLQQHPSKKKKKNKVKKIFSKKEKKDKAKKDKKPAAEKLQQQS